MAMNERRNVLRSRVLGVGWLTIVWLLLWGSFTPLTVVGGVLVGALVTVAFPLPPPAHRLPFRPLRLLALAGYVAFDVTASALQVSWQALRYGPRTRATIVAVPLLSASDRVATIVADAVTLTPGTAAVQIDQKRRVWYVYALGPRDRTGAEHARRRAMVMQRRVLAALGSPDEIAEADRRLGVTR